MQSVDRLAEMIFACIPEKERDASVSSEHVKQLAKHIANRFGKPNLPNSGETTGVSLSKLKTAALFFDRVWYPPGLAGEVPTEVSMFGATDVEVWPIVLTLCLHPPTVISWQLMQEVFGEDTVIA